MNSLQIPLIELVVRGAVVYFALLLMLRLTGKRTVGQSTPFDLLVIMLLSEAANGSMTGGDTSLVGGLVVCAVLMLINLAMSYLTARSRTFEALLEGEAVLVGRNGTVFDKVLATYHISRSDLERALREADCRLDDLQCAFLEADGTITVQKRSTQNAASPERKT